MASENPKNTPKLPSNPTKPSANASEYEPREGESLVDWLKRQPPGTKIISVTDSREREKK